MATPVLGAAGQRIRLFLLESPTAFPNSLHNDVIFGPKPWRNITADLAPHLMLATFEPVPPTYPSSISSLGSRTARHWSMKASSVEPFCISLIHLAMKSSCASPMLTYINNIKNKEVELMFVNCFLGGLYVDPC